MVQGRTGPFTVLFCSYGSPHYRPLAYSTGTPLVLGDCARISLRPLNCSHPSPHPPAGLLFTQEEFDEVIHRFKGHDDNVDRLDEGLQEMLFVWTSGHAGAVADLLHMLAFQVGHALTFCLTFSDLNFLQKRKELREGETLTVAHFFNSLPKGEFVNTLRSFPNFGRGIPLDEDLQDPDIAAVFRELLVKGNVTGKQSKMTEAVNTCHRRGWIHAGLKSDETSYILASPLHAIYLSWKLLPVSVEFPYKTVRDMTFAIIKTFNPSQLSSLSHIGEDSTDRPVEARYQYEFYRGVSKATGGGVAVCPEILSARGARKGRLDLFIPSHKWGIEFTREGGDLARHDSRFGFTGAYGEWLSSGDVVDYILLDCRTSMPKKSHPSKVLLLHQTAHD